MTAPRLIVIAVVVAVFVAFLTTFTVRFNERAVVTTFGKASESSVYTEPGLRLKWPPPIQDVTKYDARTRFLQVNQETQQTAETAQVLVTLFMTWRVDDPLKFYRRFSNAGESERDHYRLAEQILEAKLRSSASAVSKYRLGELVSANASGSKIADLEKDIFATLTAGAAASDLAEAGIKPVAVGVAGLGLPQQTTTQVFEAMKQARLKIANDAIAKGSSLGSTIRSSAESDAKKIESFAEQLATRIRNQGDVEAAQYLAMLREDPQLAVFLENMKFMRETFGKTTTLVLPTSMPGLGLFRPDAIKSFKSGQVPDTGLERVKTPQGSMTTPAQNDNTHEEVRR